MTLCTCHSKWDESAKCLSATGKTLQNHLQCKRRCTVDFFWLLCFAHTSRPVPSKWLCFAHSVPSDAFPGRTKKKQKNEPPAPPQTTGGRSFFKARQGTHEPRRFGGASGQLSILARGQRRKKTNENMTSLNRYTILYILYDMY